MSLDILGAVMNALYRIVLFFAVIAAMPAYSWTASCSNYNASLGVDQRIVYASFGSQIVVPNSTPIGSVIAKYTHQPSGTNAGVCTTTGTYGIAYRINLSSLSSLGGNIYNTNVAGIGIRVTSATGSLYSSGENYSDKTALSANTIVVKDDDAFVIELIKTGSITPGTLSFIGNGMFLQVMLGAKNGEYSTVAVFLGSNPQIVQPACEASTSNISVPLGKFRKSTMASIGATTSKQMFTIPITCSKSSSIKITIGGSIATNTVATQGVLKLDDNVGAASGVGVQLLKSDGVTPVTLGSEIGYGTSSMAGEYNVSFYAGYYRTQNEISAGVANSTATFTITYN